MQDFLCLGKEARMNKPSTIGGNWTWRVDKDEMNSCLSRKIRELTKRYGR
jgi:4-alpha-glucanotransferase